MGDKKDPGKFTIRFNTADPQQQAVVDILNRQGRYKAQFITNAVLFYTYAASDAQTVSLQNSAVIQRVMANQGPKYQDATATAENGAIEPDCTPLPIWGSDLKDTELDSIRKTMEIFRPK